MLPRWLAVLGFVGLCTSFACFPPVAVAPIASTYQPTGATPRPSVAWSPSPSPAASSPTPPAGSPSPAPSAAT